MFLVSLVNKGSKCFESFSLAKNDKRRFKFSEENLLDTIKRNIEKVRKAINLEFIINHIKHSMRQIRLF